MNFSSRAQKIRAQVTRVHLHVRKIRRAQLSVRKIPCARFAVRKIRDPV
jgi:hypothetical protein